MEDPKEVEDTHVDEPAPEEPQPTEAEPKPAEEPQHSERPVRKHIGNLHVEYDDDEEENGDNKGNDGGGDHNSSSRPTVDFRDKTTRYYRWLYDRIDGSSRYNDSNWGKPPCSACYVPKPVGWFPDLIEMNPVFERFGRIGCVGAENPKVRFALFILALFCNFTALGLSVLSYLAVTHENFDMLRAFSYSRGVFDLNGDRDIQVDIGLRSVAFEDTRLGSDIFGNATTTMTTTRRILDFGTFCDIYVDINDGLTPNLFMTPEECAACESNSFRSIITLAISIFFTFPSITTDFLRMWPNYDVNCQKFFGALVGSISLISSVVSWFGYAGVCRRDFDNDSLVLFSNFTIPSPGTDMSVASDFIFIEREWSNGWGLIFLLVATLLKGIDSICNWIVPTPRITRDHNEQRAYEYLVTQGRSVSAFERLHQQHQAQEVHTGLELADKGEHSGSVWRAHRLLGIPEPEPENMKHEHHEQHHDEPE